MANGVNKVILIGRLGNDPEMKTLPSGTKITSVSLATSESWKDKQSGEKQERTEWHRVVFYGRQAEIADLYLGKGSQFYIEGKLQTDKWEDKDGNTRYTTKVVVSNMQMLGSKSSSERKSEPARSDNYDEDFDDDIPF